MQNNFAGEMIQKWWTELAHKFKNIELDKFIIMPNHMHGIIIIDDTRRGEASSPSDIHDIKQGRGDPAPTKRTLGQIIAYYKYQTAKHINESRSTPGFPVWQRNYYEHIIRNEPELNKIREYIISNPLNWENDENYREIEIMEGSRRPFVDAAKSREGRKFVV